MPCEEERNDRRARERCSEIACQNDGISENNVLNKRIIRENIFPLTKSHLPLVEIGSVIP